MLAKASIYACVAVRRGCFDPTSASRSDLELRSLDPVPEVGARRLLQVGRVHGLERAERDEVVFVLMRGEPLHERLLRDVILAPRASAAEALHRQAGHGVNDVVLTRPAAALGGRSFLNRRFV